MKRSKDGKVVFIEENHVYKLGEKKLISVTQYISKYKHPFNIDIVAGKYAKKHNLIKEDVIKEWKDKGLSACTMGTFIHKIFEDYILGNEIDKNIGYNKYATALKFIEEIFKTKRLIPVETEYIVYNNNYAGQIDCIVKNKDNEYFILDFKTNTDIKFDNRWQKMLLDYDYLDDCSFNHYSIQLSVYRKMIKEYNIKACYLVHIKDNEYEFIKTKNIKVDAI